MASSEIKIPTFDFSGFYYAEILEALLLYKRDNIPEISNENPFETGVQMLRATALVGHLNNVLLDLAANEAYLPTAQVRDNVVRILSLIGFNPFADIPAISTLRAQLTQTYTSGILIVPDNALFGTKRRANSPSILYEADNAITISATDRLDACWKRDETGFWTDYTTEANGAGNVILEAVAGRALYFAHDTTFNDAIEFSGLSGFDPGDDRSGSPVRIYLQYFDGQTQDAAPDSISVQPSNLKFYLNGLVGAETKVGSDAFVTLNSTGASERRPIQFDVGGNFIETTAFLGQTTISTDVGDYTVGSLWKDVQVATDTTAATAEQTETFDNGNGADQSFSTTLNRYPLEPDTIVTWSYFAGTIPKNASFDLETGAIAGDAAAGTTVDPNTGISTLNTSSVPDVGAISVTYQRKSATLRTDGSITYLPPFNDKDDWRQGELPEELRGTTGPTLSGYWLRLLISSVGAGSVSNLVFDRAIWDSNGLYIRVPVTQGQTVSESLGSGTGAPSQTFVLNDAPVIEGSIILTIDGEVWTQVPNFFSSSDVDEHFTVTIDSDGIATILTGDGENGRVVPVGTNNVSVEYRIGAREDGNVGAGQISVSRSGISRVRNITNPRAATGWIPQEGSDALGLEKLKRDGVNSLRALERAVSPADVNYFTRRFLLDGQRLFSRSNPIENGFGLKTVRNVVVPAGGGSSSPEQRQALDRFFNGDINEGGTEEGILVINQRVTSVDYSPRVIDVTMNVAGGDEAAIRAALTAVLQPEAIEDDEREDGDVSSIWEFGQTIAVSRIEAIVYGADRDVTKVETTLPAADILLNDDELPLLGTLTLTVV